MNSEQGQAFHFPVLNEFLSECRLPWHFAGGATAVKDSKRSTREAADEEPESTFYDAMKNEMAERAARTKVALDALDPLQRVAMEGYRPGTYLRLRFKGRGPVIPSLAYKVQMTCHLHIEIQP